MEIEALLGNAVRIARRHGVPVPKLESLYALLLMLERKGVH
jgi:2-dehydropantoate 2-reductase